MQLPGSQILRLERWSCSMAYMKHMYGVLGDRKENSIDITPFAIEQLANVL